MMRVQRGLCLALMFLSLSTGKVKAQQDDRAHILAVMERAFEADHSFDQDTWREIQLAEGTVLSFRPDPGGVPGKLEMRMAQNDHFLSQLKDDGHDYMERWTADPTVMIRGPIAVVWGEYEYWIDGEFSHCGIDSIDLVKVDGEWKIANFMWTVERDNCPTDPSR